MLGRAMNLLFRGCGRIEYPAEPIKMASPETRLEGAFIHAPSYHHSRAAYQVHSRPERGFYIQLGGIEQVGVFRGFQRCDGA